jgi:hypothetical protein
VHISNCNRPFLSLFFEDSWNREYDSVCFVLIVPNYVDPLDLYSPGARV